MNREQARPSEPAPSRPERARLFVALELPPPARDELLRWYGESVSAMVDVDGVAGLRPVNPDALHATLCFLGSRPVQEIDAIAAACLTIATERPLALSLGAPLWLPRRRPRVLAVELLDHDRTQPLLGLQSRLARALSAGGFYRPADRPFLGHITVARVPSRARVRARALAAPQPLSIVATGVTLYRSHLGRPEVRYEPLATVRLTAAGEDPPT